MNEDIKPWLNHYPAGLDWDTDIKRQPLYETLAQTAARRRDHVATLCFAAEVGRPK